MTWARSDFMPSSAIASKSHTKENVTRWEDSVLDQEVGILRLCSQRCVASVHYVEDGAY